MDFAFFVVNFGYSKSDYDSLTLREKAFIYKAWEDKTVRDSYNMYNAVFTATYNVNRPKRKRALKLWKKSRIRKADMDTVKHIESTIHDIDAKEGKGWIDVVYAANGLPGLDSFKKKR